MPLNPRNLFLTVLSIICWIPLFSAELGTVENGLYYEGVAESNLESYDWTFDAVPGDTVWVTVSRFANDYMDPRFYITDPDEEYLSTAVKGLKFAITEVRIEKEGTHRIKIHAQRASNTGKYRLNYFKVPGAFVVNEGDEGGELTARTSTLGTLHFGDLDPWSVYAEAGDVIAFGVGVIEGEEPNPEFNPEFVLHAPNGEFLPVDLLVKHERLVYVAQISGIHTILVKADNGNVNWPIGDYFLNFATSSRSAGVSLDDNEGPLGSGITYTGSISIRDIDVWTFQAVEGAEIDLLLSEIEDVDLDIDFRPRMEVYDPEGEQLLELERNAVVDYAFTAGKTGEYKVVVLSSEREDTATGNYELLLTNKPVLREGQESVIWLSSVDPQIDQVTNISLVQAPEGMSQGFSGEGAWLSWTPSELQGNETFAFTATVTFIRGGVEMALDETFTIDVLELNSPPVFTQLPEEIEIFEMTEWVATIIASDSDVPENPLTDKVIAGPLGLTFNSETGELSWVPTEAQGPVTQEIRISVEDSNPSAVDDKKLQTKESFSLTVLEVNLPPVFEIVSDQVVPEGSEFSAILKAIDPDIPANTISYSAVEVPVGVEVDSASGELLWIPGEEQGPLDYVVRVVAMDDGVPVLTAEMEFNVSVTEVNQAPELVGIPPFVHGFEYPLSLEINYLDGDLPANAMTFSLESGPEGMVIDPNTGLANWDVGVPELGSSVEFVVKVTDDGVPPLSDSLSFSLTFTWTHPKIDFRFAENGSVLVEVDAPPGINYRLYGSGIPGSWSPIAEFLSDEEIYLFEDVLGQNTNKRFYILELLSKASEEEVP